jgi:HlyD family secretion protein
MKKIIFTVVVIAVLGAAGMLAYRSLHPEATNRIVVSGNIELAQVDIAFKTSGRLIERTVNEGDAVQKGMVIARLDREQLLHQRDTATAALATAEAQLCRKQERPEMAARNHASRHAVAQCRFERRPVAVAAIEKRRPAAGDPAATAAVAAAQSQYDGAKKDWDRAQTLYKNDDISTSQYDQFHDAF